MPRQSMPLVSTAVTSSKATNLCTTPLSQSCCCCCHCPIMIFNSFGDRVKKWTTFNEPWVICTNQYGNGDFAPGVNYGDSGKWKCGHHLLLAHAAAVKLYRDSYKTKQGGKIGMALWSEWSEPYSDKPEGKSAVVENLRGTTCCADQ